MIIQIKKFGEILISRPAGREAALIMLGMISPSDKDPIQLDFTGVQVVAPSWLHEVLLSLKEKIGDRVSIMPTTNPTVVESLKVISISPE